MKNIKYRLANLLGLNTDASLFEINHDEIQKTNLLFLQQISFTSGLIMLLLYLVSLVLPSIADLRMTYFMEFLVSAIIFVLTCVAFDTAAVFACADIFFDVGDNGVWRDSRDLSNSGRHCNGFYCFDFVFANAYI